MKIFISIFTLLIFFSFSSWSSTIDLQLQCKFRSVTACISTLDNKIENECDIVTLDYNLKSSNHQDGSLKITFDGQNDYFISSDIISFAETNMFVSEIKRHSVSDDKYIFEGMIFWKETMSPSFKLELNFNRLTGKLSAYMNAIHQDVWEVEFYNCSTNKHKF
ncbi:hypothetical protein HIMB100_00005000 [SAR116 cluster alpha proteobacterium HIMB100]|nr:hypothetical protein HIMB100_00005000 [SAR116 cluster alpha proteobacterium HIMB100]